MGRVRYTTGPATRHALAAAGALGATTGTTVHLPHGPSVAPGMLGVVAHELAHTRNPVGRPRFLLSTPTGDADEDERAALVLGRRMHAAATRPDAVGAGIVENLPVGGTGSIAEIATQAARTAVRDHVENVTQVMDPGLTDPGVGHPGDVGGVGALPGMGGIAQFGVTQFGVTQFAGGTGADGSNVPNATATGSVASATAGQPGAARAPGSGLPGAGAPVDIEQLAEAIEERLLRQIERRGGRYAGVF